jgi:hypothetical protein
VTPQKDGGQRIPITTPKTISTTTTTVATTTTTATTTISQAEEKSSHQDTVNKKGMSPFFPGTLNGDYFGIH